MLGLSAKIIATFGVSLVFQLAALSLLPKTQGFTNIVYTVVFMTLYTIAFAAMARLIQSGANLSVVLPLFSAVVPLVTVALGIFIYGESASLQKVAMLVVACVLVGLASRY